MTRAAVLSEANIVDWTAAYHQGKAPARLPYGLDALETRGVYMSPESHLKQVLPRKLRDVAEHRMGLPIEGALRAIPEVRKADFVVALLETQGFFAAGLKGRGVPPFGGKPLIVMSCWLAQRAISGDKSQRSVLVDRLKSADLITHLSRHEHDVLVDLGFHPDQLMPMTYGVSDDYYTPTDQDRDIDILAVGQDSGRDYATLFRAVAGTELKIKLVCKPANLTGLTVPSEVEVVGTVPLSEYRSLLRRAKVVAVPTKDFLYPTGTSVALEASACGACVVLTGTRAMKDYFVDGENGLLVEVGDPEGWRSALRRALGDPELVSEVGVRARSRVESTFNPRVMWGEVADALTNRGIVPGLGAR